MIWNISAPMKVGCPTASARVSADPHSLSCPVVSSAYDPTIVNPAAMRPLSELRRYWPCRELSSYGHYALESLEM